MRSHHFQASEDPDCDHLPYSPATVPSLEDGMHPQTVSQDKVVCKLLFSDIWSKQYRGNYYIFSFVVAIFNFETKNIDANI